MHKKLLLWLSLISVSAFAQERGAPILSDNFAGVALFAERWVPGDRRVKPEEGRVVFETGGTLEMRRDTPPEFYVEMDITVDMSHQPDKEKWRQAFCGFRIEGYSFFVLPAEGRTWMIYQLKGYERPHGKHVTIDGFEHNKPIRLTLARKVDEDAATYFYRVNGKDAGSFVTGAPVATPDVSGEGEKFKPLEIFSFNVNMTLENFSIYALRRSVDDSRNVILNSSFKHAIDGIPLYYARSNSFNFARYREIPYVDFLGAWTLDTDEKLFGKQSLKMNLVEGMGGDTLWAWGAGTVKDMPGVFSVWMKSDSEDFPVTIVYGKAKEVKVGTSWERYEVMNPKLPGAGFYTPVRIQSRSSGTLWIDGLQAEFPGSLDEFTEGDTFATPYKPSELDKQRLGSSEPPVRHPEIEIAKLPEGVVPDGNLGAWKESATKLENFYFRLAEARNKTEAYLACDNTNLYVGFRCFVEDISLVDTTRLHDGSFEIFLKDSVEFFLDPGADGNYYQFAADAGGTRVDIGKGGDVAWNADWQAVVKLNAEKNSVDYQITVPFYNLAGAAMSSRWLVNFCRNDRTVGEQVAITRSPVLGFKQTEYWPYARLPQDVVDRYSLGATAAGYSEDRDGMAVTLTVSNRTGNELRLRAKLLEAGREAGTLAEKEVSLKTGDNNVAFNSGTVTEQIQFKLSEGDMLLTDQVLRLEKREPVSMLGQLDYYMDEDEAVYKVNTTLTDSGEMTAVLYVAGQKSETEAGPEFKISIPLSGITDGTHPVSLSMMNGAVEVAATTSTLIKRPHREGATQINHFTRSLIHAGLPVFPVAPFFEFRQHSKEYVTGAINLLDQHGFRFLHLLVDNRFHDQGLWALETALEKDMKVILWTKYYQLSDEEGADLRKRLDFPNVIAQMVLDEPELGMPSEDAKAYLLKMRKKYPYHPVFMNNTVLGIPNNYADLETDILMLDDYLTNMEKRPVSSVIQHADAMVAVGRKMAKPTFFFLIAHNNPIHHREPSYAEQVAQTYGAIAAGCTGISYFYGDPRTPGNWRAMVQLNSEILALDDILLSEEDISGTTSTGNPETMRHITRKHDGYLYLITVNLDGRAAEEVTFTFPAELEYAEEVQVLFEDRAIPVKKGRFSDSFVSHQRHVYRIRYY